MLKCLVYRLACVSAVWHNTLYKGTIFLFYRQKMLCFFLKKVFFLYILKLFCKLDIDYLINNSRYFLFLLLSLASVIMRQPSVFVCHDVPFRGTMSSVV